MNQLIDHIKNKDWQQVLTFTASLTKSDRYETIEYLKKVDVNKDILKAEGSHLTGEARNAFFDNRYLVDACLNYCLVTCIRNYEDLKRLEAKNEHYTLNHYYSFISTPFFKPLIDFYTLFPPNYLDKVIKDLSKEKFRNIDFKVLWKLHEHHWVTFNEPFFLKSLLNIPMFHRNTLEDADFLFDHPKALQDVFLTFHKHEMPILDISKWNAREGFVCKKIHEFWTEVIIILQEKGFEFDRAIVKNLLDSLLNNWKKPHLDWHVRLLKLFKPTQIEYFENQSTLFSVLGTGQPSLIKYAVESIKSIYILKDFDSAGFINNLPRIFSNDKGTKPILIGLDILDKLLSKQTVGKGYSDQLAILLMQSDANIQEKTSNLLLKYFNDENIKLVVKPYLPYLKDKTKEILSLKDVEITLEEAAAITEHSKVFSPVTMPSTWDELLFHIGTCIRTQSALDIDLFFEGLNQLQFEIPTNFVKQLKPYTQQLSNRVWENNTMTIFSTFIISWLDGSGSTFVKVEHNPIPYLKNKTYWLLDKLQSQNSLPFLSTPTHEPFYIHPNLLLERLLEYEEKRQSIHLEDLVVACNRTLLSEIDNYTLELSKKLTGFYADAIRYFVGATDRIEYTDSTSALRKLTSVYTKTRQYLFGATEEIEYTDSTLALWTQIARIKKPSGIFIEFEKSKAQTYLSVVCPFILDFRVDTDKNEYATWYRLILENNWNESWFNKEKIARHETIFYNTASAVKGIREDITYQLTLNPQYLDAQLCRYIPDTASGNEVGGFEDCLYPIRFIVEHELPIYHSGWIYVSVCLLFEKKISRDLASDYIQLSIQKKGQPDYLAHIIGRLISSKFAPINRLIEYFDKPNNSKEIKILQLSILENCIINFDKNNLPSNSKKIIEYHRDWSTSLQTNPGSEILGKLSELKK